MTERYIIDDCGTLIDTKTRNTYDYVSEICPLLNRQDTLLKQKEKQIKFHVDGYNQLINTIQEAYETEKTDMGKSILKQLLNNIGEI